MIAGKMTMNAISSWPGATSSFETVPVLRPPKAGRRRFGACPVDFGSVVGTANPVPYADGVSVTVGNALKYVSRAATCVSTP